MSVVEAAHIKQPRFDERAQAVGVRSGLLLWIRGDQLGVLAGAEREQRVPGAAARVDASDRRTHARARLDEGDTLLQIGAPDHDVVNGIPRRASCRCGQHPPADGRAREQPQHFTALKLAHDADHNTRIESRGFDPPGGST